MWHQHTWGLLACISVTKWKKDQPHSERATYVGWLSFINNPLWKNWVPEAKESQVQAESRWLSENLSQNKNKKIKGWGWSSVWNVWVHSLEQYKSSHLRPDLVLRVNVNSLIMTAFPSPNYLPPGGWRFHHLHITAPVIKFLGHSPLENKPYSDYSKVLCILSIDRYHSQYLQIDLEKNSILFSSLSVYFNATENKILTEHWYY